MPTNSLAATGTDPLAALAEAMDAAVDAARDGAGRARITIGGLVPAAGRLVSRAVYGASYAVSFGLVLPAMLFARRVPRQNAVVHGLIDGARAAIGSAQAQDRPTGSDPAVIPHDR